MANTNAYSGSSALYQEKPVERPTVPVVPTSPPTALSNTTAGTTGTVGSTGTTDPAVQPPAPPAPPRDPLSKGYADLAAKRAAAATPEFSRYKATAGSPIGPTGETYMTPETTVAGQLASIFKKGSPLMDLTETRAREQASALGMMSSSSGIGAGQRVLYDKGLEIATPDAASASQFKGAEQALANEQTKIATEAQVAGDLTIQKAKIAEEQQKISDAFAITLQGLDKDTAAFMANTNAEWEAKFKQMDVDLARDLKATEVNALVEDKIMSQTHDMMNQYQISIQQLLANESFLSSMPEENGQAAMHAIFNDMFQTTVASIEFNAKAAGVYDAEFQGYLEDLMASSEWDEDVVDPTPPVDDDDDDDEKRRKDAEDRAKDIARKR